MSPERFNDDIADIFEIYKMFPRSGGMGTAMGTPHKKAGQMMDRDELFAKIRDMTGEEL